MSNPNKTKATSNNWWKKITVGNNLHTRKWLLENYNHGVAAVEVMRSGPPVDISIRRCLLQKAHWSSISALSRITAEQIAELCREEREPHSHYCATAICSIKCDRPSRSGSGSGVVYTQVLASISAGAGSTTGDRSH